MRGICMINLLAAHIMVAMSYAFSASQKVDVSGKHAFRAPGPTDQRGPCPGLNALANHGYLPHSGIATIGQFIEATTSVYGMGPVLATFLAVIGAFLDGDLVSWSIGGPVKDVTLGEVLGQPQGISYSHNKYEGDASITRGDLCLFGEAYKLKLQYFKALLELQPPGPGANYDIDVINIHHAARVNQSINENPFFFNSPFSGMVVAAAYMFAPRMLSNHSAERPEGILTREVMKSFFAVSGDDSNLSYMEGHERIPENWYRRPFGYEYEENLFLMDFYTSLQRYPQFGDIGGNTGSVNSFVGIDLGNLTGGMYNSATLLEGNNAACLFYQFALSQTPDFLAGLLLLQNELSDALAMISDKASKLGCPQLSKWNMAALSRYPGYSAKVGPDGTCK